MDLNFDLKKITKKVTQKNFYVRILILILATALLALNYNLFLVPKNYLIYHLVFLLVYQA